MITVSLDELNTNSEKYILLAEEEEIEVTNQGKTILYLTPQKIRLLNRVERSFGSLPRDAYYDENIERE